MTTKLNIGMIGCGAIAQIQYLPIMQSRRDEFTIGGLADLSPALLEAVGEQYGVPPDRRFTDYHDLLASDIDAVVVCPSGSHAPASIAAARAGKHALVEKPMCVTVDEATAMAEAADTAGTHMMVAYMKRYEPAYRYAESRIRAMSDVRFIQVNHLHPDNSLHLAEFRTHRFNDIPAEVRERSASEHAALIAKALHVPDGEAVPPDISRAFSSILGSMIHDIGNLHGAFGPPARVLSTEIWAEGRAITTTLAYEDDKRAVCSWVDLPELWDFRETLEAYGSRERVIVSFPTGFARGLPSIVTEHGMDDQRQAWRKELSWHDNPFEIELRHFRDCVLSGTTPDTTAKNAVHDIALVRDIVLAYLNRAA